MQCRDGGWAAFDVDNTRALCRELPFCDFGELIDPPSADVTAHVDARDAGGGDGYGLRWDGRRTARPPDEGPTPRRPPAGSLWLARCAGVRWFVVRSLGLNHLYGTGAVVPALIAAGVSPDHPAVRRAVAWVEEHQNDDGGWGEDLRSYRDRPRISRAGVSNACQTAWALLALLAADERGPATERGVAFLVDTQLADGTWDETWFTGHRIPRVTSTSTTTSTTWSSR